MPATLRYPHYLLLLALALGICADSLFYQRWPGISIPLFVALCLAALGGISRLEDRPPTRANLWMGGAALGFAICLMLRATPLLIVLNLLALLGLLLLLVATYRGPGLIHLPGWRYLTHALRATLELVWRPLPVTIQATQHMPLRMERARQLVPVGRGLLLALPVLTGFTLLLMAADSIFASYVNQIFSLRIPFDTEVFFSRLTLVLLVTWTCAGGMLVALHSTRKPTAPVIRGSLPAEGDTQPLTPPATAWRPLGWVEAVTVLVSVDLLFGGFMLIQTTYFFGGLDTLTRTGMTYAEYARRGFFELLAVACLALALLWLLALVTRREQPWQQLIFNATNALMILLVLGVLASAFQRMLLYEQAYGFTRLRIYTHSFMLWLALVLLLFLVALLRERPRLFTAGSFVSALIYLALLNLANPDALIVRENVARYQESGKLDAFYLTTLSNDAIPALVDALAVVEGPERKIILRELGWRHSHLSAVAAESGWPGWHLARARAVAATTPIAAAMNEEQME
jgi:hypothetical protein